MGYDLHITRRQDWCDVGNDISKEEFIALVKANAEFYYPSDNDEDCAEWHSPKTGYVTRFWWSDGQLQTKNPEPEFIEKAVLLAKHLRAKAQGDDGEVYTSATEYSQSDEGDEIVRKKSWWKFW